MISRDLRPALFLDRDGIVIEDTGYVSSTENIRFVDGVFDLCRVAIDKGYIVVIVTNQSGVARGYFTIQTVDTIHAWIAGEFEKRSVVLSGIYSCPHHPRGTVPEFSVDCNCRKPRPGLLLKAAEDLGIDFSRSLMIGDKQSDRIAIEGLRSLVVKSRYVGDGEWDIADIVGAESYL